MPPSAPAAEPTAVQDKSRGLWVLGAHSTTGAARVDNGAAPLKNPGLGANSPMSELAQLMQEPAHGPNSGRRASDNPEREGQHVPLGAEDWQAAEFMRAGGWSIVHAKDGARAGVSAHRGATHPDEYVDPAVLRGLVEHELGFTYEQVRSVYRQGPLSADQRELRARIDARLLALSRAGGNLAELGRALGFKVERDSHCEPMDNAVARAQAAEAEEGNS